MRKFLVAAIAVVMLAPLAMAETFFGRITKVDGNKITVQKFSGGQKKGDKKKGDRKKGDKKKGDRKKGGFKTETVEVTANADTKIQLGTFDRETRKFKASKTLTLLQLAERVGAQGGKGDKKKGDRKKGNGNGDKKKGGFRGFRGAFAQIVAENGVASEINVLDFSGFGKKGKGKKKKADG